jgi:hypothetical protein
VASVAPADSTDTVRNTDFSARFPVANEGNSGKPAKTRESAEPNQPFPFSGLGRYSQSGRAIAIQRCGPLRCSGAAFMKGDGVEMNFEGPMYETVARPARRYSSA